MTCACHHEDATTHRRTVARRTVLAGGLALGVAPFLPGWAGIAGATGGESAEGTDGSGTRDFGFLPPRPATEVHQRNIMFPVLPHATLGRATWTDTYLAPRSNGRKHEGQDLMGKKMLKLVACIDGTIVELRHRANPSGNSLYLKGIDGYYYCYLHINNDTPGTDNASNVFGNAFAPGMAVGKAVKRGEHIAYVGDSGNAEATGSHCHFEIRLPNAKWYNAAACNAKYSLQAAEPAKLRTKGPASTFAPFSGSYEFAAQQGTDFLGGVPSSAWLATAVDQLDSGTVGPDAFIEKQLADTRLQGVVNPMIRLYQAYFGGIPTSAGVDYWMRRIRGGQTLDSASTEIAASTRFTTTYDVADSRRFVAVFFKNLYGYAPSAASIDLRINRMRAGMTRGALVRYDCESSGYRTPSANRTRVISVYHAMVRQAPVQNWLDYWVFTDAGRSSGMSELIKAHRTSTKYAARFD